MALPFFYIENTINESSIVLNEETSKHIVQVLRMQNGEQLQLTDGKGNLFTWEVTNNATQQQKFIAHCEDENNKVPLTSKLLHSSTSKLILIGPEGDFTNTEIQLALQNGFTPVALGDTRLRTETAGMVAACLFKMH
ncbi:MAG: RNA methyltransferase [Chitinophagaceae bacterium]|nr:RNA methyltransferase [Chitinophagaceae bacterium]